MPVLGGRKGVGDGRVRDQGDGDVVTMSGLKGSLLVRRGLLFTGELRPW